MGEEKWKILEKIAWLAGIVWTLFVFFTSVSPEDVRSRTSGWLSLPIANQLPPKFINFAANPIILSLTFLSVGAYLGIQAYKWRKAREGISWWKKLGYAMDNIANEIATMDYRTDQYALNARIHLLAIETEKNNLPFPTGEPNAYFQELIPYLRQISVYLYAGQVDHARITAVQLTKSSTQGQS